MIDSQMVTINIWRDGRPFGWFDLRILPSVEAVQALNRKWYGIEPDGNEPWAFCYAFTKARSTKIGAMIIAVDATRYIVTHECLHMASAMFRRLFPQGTNLGITSEWAGRYEDNPEEIMADLVGMVTDSVLTKIEALPGFDGWPTVE